MGWTKTGEKKYSRKFSEFQKEKEHPCPHCSELLGKPNYFGNDEEGNCIVDYYFHKCGAALQVCAG